MKLDQIQTHVNVVKQIKRLLYDHLGQNNVTQRAHTAQNSFGPPFTHFVSIIGQCDSNYQVDQIGEDVEQILQQAGFDGWWQGSKWLIVNAKGAEIAMINKFYFVDDEFDNGIWDNNEVVLWIPVIRK